MIIDRFDSQGEGYWWPLQLSPIALTSCVGKFFHQILSDCICSFLVGNNYLDSESQKAFLKRISGCEDHNLVMREIISEIVSMKLLYTMCVPNLTYACEALNYTVAQFQPLNVAINDSLRKIFGYNRWESVCYLRQLLGYPSLTDIFHSRLQKFKNWMPFFGNTTLTFLDSFSYNKE